VLPFLYAFIGGAAAVTAEWLYKQPYVIDAPLKWALAWMPLQAVIGYCVFRMVNMPGATLLDAFIVFAFCTAFLRIFVAIGVLHQTIPLQSWIAFALVLAATCVKTFWSGT
jgi:hypothetical protein